MKYSYPVILSIPTTKNVCIQIFREFAQLRCLLQDMDNVQKAANPLSGEEPTHKIQSTVNALSGTITHHIQIQTKIFKLQRIHTLIDLDIVPSRKNSRYSRAKTQITFLIASQILYHLWSCLQHLYISGEMTRR